MLVYKDFTCDKCRCGFREIAQYQVRQCKTCGKMFVFCDECKPKAVCDWCGGNKFGIYDIALDLGITY